MKRTSLPLRRRDFIMLLGGAAAWPLTATAQQPERMRRIGVFMSLAADDKQAQARLAAFLQGLQELGWTDGHNARIDIRSSVAAAGIVTPLTMCGRVLSWPCHTLSQPNS